MVRKYLLPILGIALLGFAVFHVIAAQQKQIEVRPPIEPPRTPFRRTVAGAGMVEAQTENIAIGSHMPGVVTEVFVKVGQHVRAGDPLFRLDDRQLRAEIAVHEAAVAAAKAELARLESRPRPEELPVSEARVREAKANLADAEDRLRRVRAARNAVTAEELFHSEQAYAMAREQLARVQAEYDLLRAGAWEPDKAVARAAVVQAEAQLSQVKTELERLTVRALVEGDVLQVNVRPGEFVGTPPNQPLVVLGDIHRLHIRVDIDEHDIPRFEPGAPARGVLRGEHRREFPLTFVRVEPFVVPKKSLTGDNTERVDTRVLQVIYAFEPGTQSVYVGQQLDVFIDAGKEDHPSASQQAAVPRGR